MSDGRGTLTAGDVLTLAELRAVRRPSALRGLGLVLHAWAVIAGAMLVFVAWPSVLTLAGAVVVIGSRQLGLAVLMHEASHWLLIPHQRANNWIGAWLCAYPLGEDLAGYRRRHHLHHRYTQQEADPDLALGTAWPVTRRAWWLSVLRDLAGITAAGGLLGGRPWAVDAARWRRLRGPVLTHAGLLGVLALLGQWHLYVLLWLLPLATWYRLVNRLRHAAEHALVDDVSDPWRNARTTRAGLLARAFLAPYWVNYHLEHHLMVFVPCWRLPAVHARLLAQGHGPSMQLAPSYAALITRATAASGAG
jgi:fatty acid desaturase